MRREEVGIPAGIGCFASMIVLGYVGVSLPVSDAFLTNVLSGLVVTFFAFGCGALWWTFKDVINAKVQPKRKVHVEAQREHTRDTIGLEQFELVSLTKAQKFNAIVRTAVAGYGGGITMGYIGFQLLPVLPKATSATFFLVPLVCFGAAIFLPVFATYQIVAIARSR